jgi:hypothetical protein
MQGEVWPQDDSQLVAFVLVWIPLLMTLLEIYARLLFSPNLSVKARASIPGSMTTIGSFYDRPQKPWPSCSASFQSAGPIVSSSSKKDVWN